MAYLGLQPNTPLLNTSTQTFSGNSVATQFTLARSVATASDLDVMIGSTMQRPFTDYVAGNVSLQFTSAPTTGANNITVTYRAGALNSLDLTVNTFNAGTVAAPGVVSLAANNTGIYWANASSMSVTVSGTNRATFSSSPNATSTDTGALQVNGGMGIEGNVIIGGNVVIGDTTESTSVSTGSFKTAGGMGVTGNLNIGGDITCVGDFTVNGTFTTTGTDSLAVTDPFIFLAINNPGDTYDSGVISQFFDGANLRYTGYFRDITDAKYKLFTNLLTEPTTTVDTTDPSFQLTDLILANLSATGNVEGTYFIGNGAALTGISTTTSNIFNANTSVAIAAVNANVNMVVNGTQIANVWSGGISVVGAVAASTTLSATGNIIGGNIQTAGIFSATGNITSAGNISAGNVVVGGIVSSVGNVTGGNVIGTTAVSTGGNVIGGNIRTGGIVSAAGTVYGDSFSATNGITAGTDISAIGIVTGATVNSNGDVSAVGNVTGANINGPLYGNVFATTVSASGNVTGGNLNAGTGNISSTGNIIGGNVAFGTLLSGASISTTATVTFATTASNINIGNAQTTGNIIAGGPLQTGFIGIGRSTASQTMYLANGVTGTGNTKTISFGENGAAGSTTLINIGPVSATTAAGTATFNTATVVAVANTSGTALSVAGNITGANINTGGVVSATGNIRGGNVNTVGQVSATANITGGNIITTAAMSAASVSASATVIAVGNITGGNILTGGEISATANITGGNLIINGLATVTGNVTSTANVAGGNILTANLVQGAIVSATSNVIATGNVNGGNLNAVGLSLSGNVISGLATTANITGGNVISVAAISAASVSSSGNIIGGNILTAGQLVSSQTGNSDTGAGQLYLNGTGNNRIDFNTQGTGAPAFTTRSAGAKVVLYPNIGAAAADYALGIDSGVLWSGVPDSSGQFKWYAGTTQVGSLSGAGVFSAVGNISGANVNITGGYFTNGTTTLSTTAVNGNVVLTPTGSGVIIASKDITNGQANGVGNIGSATGYFNTVHAKATSAQYADLAEWYEADADYPPGTVLVFGGEKEVTVAIGFANVRVAGVVSTNPAHIMNSGLKAEHTAALALTGRVPTLVIGEVKKGDMMVTGGGGRAMACATPSMGSVIGKALQDHPGGQGMIEIVVGRV